MVKSLMWLLESVTAEAGTRCSTDTHRDIVKMKRRIKHEGMSFLTITLPTFASEFEKSLEQGAVLSYDFPGWKRRMCLPAFLQGFTKAVFDPKSGVLLDEPSVDAIDCIRQICLMWKKIHLPCSPEREKAAFSRFIECEYELTGLIERIPTEDLLLFSRVSELIWPRVLQDMEKSIYLRTHVPKHGPGATAEKISGNQKFNLRTWHTRLEPSFPFELFGLPTPDTHLDCEVLSQVEFVEPGAEMPVRVITVPKTLKTPRIIAIEPVCMQYAQQALAESIVDLIEDGEATWGRVNFRNQGVNRLLAKSASRDRTLATLDLSEASDRVHKDLVDLMLMRLPLTREAVFACRSTRAEVAGCVIQLEKFASMGSALCFPIEAMVFFTICLMAIWRESSTTLTYRNLCEVAASIYVYGDDLIVPVDKVEAVSALLETFGLKVNIAKSFSKGNFRESCGMDAYNGEQVTPTYLRRMPPTNRHQAAEIVSYVSFANQLYTRGWWTTARRVREKVEGLIGHLPHVRETAPCLGWNSLRGDYSFQRWDQELHRPLVKSYVIKNQHADDPVTGYPALMKYFLKRGSTPLSGDHLERSVRPGRVSIKSRWASPY